MQVSRRRLTVPLAAVFLTACATVNGPSVMVLPGSGKSFEQFQADDAVCQQWAYQQTGITPQHAQTGNVVAGAAIGTVAGAAAGAAIGAAAGSPATGAAVGAGVGALGGTTVGASSGYAAGTSVQNRFDIAYVQCMYAKGNQVPLPRGTRPQVTPGPPPPPASSTMPPAPPPGPPPPPPPRG
jgi:OmpA family protein